MTAQVFTLQNPFDSFTAPLAPPLFGSYQRYYNPNISLPIDALKSLKPGTMVIQPSKLNPDRYLAIFRDHPTNTPFIKVFDVAQRIFKCDKIEHPSFEHFLKHFNANVVPENPDAFSLPFSKVPLKALVLREKKPCPKTKRPE